MNKKTILTMPLAVFAMGLTSCNGGWPSITKEKANQIIEKTVSPQSEAFDKVFTDSSTKLTDIEAKFKKLHIVQNYEIEILNKNTSGFYYKDVLNCDAKFDIEKRNCTCSYSKKLNKDGVYNDATANISILIDTANKVKYTLYDDIKIGGKYKDIDVDNALANYANSIKTCYLGGNIFTPVSIKSVNDSLPFTGYQIVFDLTKKTSDICGQIDALKPDTSKGYIGTYAFNSDKDEDYKFSIEYKNKRDEAAGITFSYLESYIKDLKSIEGLEFTIAKNEVTYFNGYAQIKDSMPSVFVYDLEVSGLGANDQEIKATLKGTTRFDYSTNNDVSTNGYFITDAK